MPEIDKLLRFLVDQEGSDLHLMCGARPLIRVHGDLRRIDFSQGNITLSPELNRSLIYEMLDDDQIRHFEATGDIDLAYELEGIARFRVNVHNQISGPSTVMRTIPTNIATVEQLGLPEQLKDIARFNSGLILVTGPTGSGKTTSLAAMMDQINDEREGHIVTIEDPIEFVHQNKKCLITQREVGVHTNSFAAALRVALRQDPDIILVGEMRDLETISLALTAAETGSLVFATLHTNSAAKTINRIIDVFPNEAQNQIRTLLSECLSAVIAQTLMKRSDKRGRIAAMEVMICNPAIRNAIRENKIEQIISIMQTAAREGMQMLDDHLLRLVEQGVVSRESAREKALEKHRFN
ncbi:MAG: type IV pilus twitching motility protein PilT [Candidatus Abyssobacteria bacterium SURF_17]|uniref:Type IV pilus twitching motility protein PilT n=1 Tax=Candidatus Abyssobacteria bacterium SURF_17 TaxID=2093361 RepID=A0A419EZD7_9BACT|nr:MAG: type IV pilus twitching motility protein PilT [Candidatus Abyssubacteria bacterium SURF_17]